MTREKLEREINRLWSGIGTINTAVERGIGTDRERIAEVQKALVLIFRESPSAQPARDAAEAATEPDPAALVVGDRSLDHGD